MLTDTRQSLSFTGTVKQILLDASIPLTPQEIRESVKETYGHWFATDSHQKNVEKGHYKDLDHALLAQIYSVVRTSDAFYCDKSEKPMKVSLVDLDSELEVLPEDFESDLGIVYILQTDTYTKEGKEIVKIGFTIQPVEKRITQLYTTGVPYKFKLHTQIQTKNFIELEQALHKLLNPFKLNKSREFFTSDVLEFIPQIVEIHKKIVGEG